MHSLLAVVAIAGSAFGPADLNKTSCPVIARSAVTQDPLIERLERLAELLDRLCELLGGDNCSQGTSADEDMQNFIDDYGDNGIPTTLSSAEEAEVMSLIEDAYDHVSVPLSGSSQALDAFRDALESACSDLGGDPANL